MHFQIYTLSLLLFPSIFCYWESEESLLEVLLESITKREQLLEKSNRHLVAFIKSVTEATATYSCFRDTTEASEQLWTNIKYLTIIVVEWPNFFEYVSTWPNLAQAIRARVISKYQGIYADYVTEDNLYKLINFVGNIIKYPNIMQDRNATLKLLQKQNVLNKVYKFKESLKKFMKLTVFRQPEETYVNKDVYSKLCRGETEINFNSLFVKCRYFHNNHPYLIIGPFKMEELQKEPPVRFFHDVLTDSEIELMKEMAIDQKMTISQGKETFYRVAKIAWLPQHNLESVYRKTGLLTNLDMNSAEGLQVGVYGVAGHYEPHYDAAIKHADITSTRIATVLYYFNDNFEGGATVFPALNLTVLPKKGSALVWYNLKSDYEVDTRSLHASCPLYSGVKWVLNTWIRHEGQEFRQPCDSVQTDTFTLGKPYPVEV